MACKMVGAGAQTTTWDVLDACNMGGPETFALRKSRMDVLEFEVGSKLEWMLNAATPTEFINLFLSRAESTGVLEQAPSCSARERATTTAFQWASLGFFAHFKPSELACAAVYSAVLRESDAATARKVTEVDGSGIPDLLQNARFSMLLRANERCYCTQLYSPEPTMTQAVDADLLAVTGKWDSAWSDAGRTYGNEIDGNYDTEGLTPPSTAGSASPTKFFFQDEEKKVMTTNPALVFLLYFSLFTGV